MCFQLQLLYSYVLQWKEFLEVGKAVPDSELEERIRGQAPNKCCTLIYTVSVNLFYVCAVELVICFEWVRATAAIAVIE